MKNLLKKYYDLDEESKEILPFLYMYHELLSSKDDYDNIKIETMSDEDIIMQTIIKCWYNTNLDAINIVDKLLSILNNQEISIKDLENIDIDELQKLMSDEQPTEESSILAEFVCGVYYCVLLKNHEQYLLVLNNDEDSDVIAFNKLEDIFKPIINKHLLDQFLYGKPKHNANTDF